MEQDEVTLTAFTGFLTESSPLRAIFQSGIVPLASPKSVEAELGAVPNLKFARVYLIVLRQVTPDQKKRIAEMMHRLGQGTLAEAERVLAIDEVLPILETNISGVGFPLRYVL